MFVRRSLGFTGVFFCITFFPECIYTLKATNEQTAIALSSIRLP